MNNFLTDRELDEMFDEQPYPEPSAPMVPVQEYPQLPQPEPVPLYSLQLAQVPTPQPPEQPQVPDGQQGLLMKKVGPLPMWGWGLIALGVGGTGYFAYRSMKKNPKSSGDDEGSTPSLGEIVSKAFTPNDGGSSTGWEPSRSRFAEQLERYFQRKGQSQHVKVWHDAEDAKEKGQLKFVSPLINIQIKNGTVKLDKALIRFCRREGLNPQSHIDGSIGLYPHSSKRGREWEEYIDALRDDGQKI